MKAFAVYGAAAPAGGTAGVFLGGVITEWASRPWVFYSVPGVGTRVRAVVSLSPHQANGDINCGCCAVFCV